MTGVKGQSITKVNKNITLKMQRHQQVSFELELGMLAKTRHSLFYQVLKYLHFQ